MGEITYAYDTLGRFTSRDPIPGALVMPQTLNPYAYGAGNPSRYPDPSGMSIFESIEETGSAISTFPLLGAAPQLMGLLEEAEPSDGETLTDALKGDSDAAQLFWITIGVPVDALGAFSTTASERATALSRALREGSPYAARSLPGAGRLLRSALIKAGKQTPGLSLLAGYLDYRSSRSSGKSKSASTAHAIGTAGGGAGGAAIGAAICAPAVAVSDGGLALCAGSIAVGGGVFGWAGGELAETLYIGLGGR